ncbi:MAG: sigma-70 family RNA polymerase sigma factor [Chloroflexota bacterium]|nr:sigma-70 family RNA polymerase sigma factor [Chloroflexota bacterium]
MTVNDEQKWIGEARRGDRTAFSRLVEVYQIPVYNLAYRMLGNRQEAEDAAQETFLRAYKRLASYNPNLKFRNWILSIASHHCIDKLRRRRFTWLSIEDNPSLSWLASDDQRPEDAAIRSERSAEVRGLLDFLEPGYRAPLVLRYWHDLSYKEIAETLDLTESAVKSRLHRARIQMAALLEEQAAKPVETDSNEQPESTTKAKNGRKLNFKLGKALGIVG